MPKSKNRSKDRSNKKKVNKQDNNKLKKKFQNLLDLDRILKETPDVKKLKVTLKKDKIKGTGLYATKGIKKGEIIAYYKIKVFNFDKYDSPTNNVYTFDVYTSKGNDSKTFIGDLDEDSFPPPLNGISFWAPFANEPTTKQKTNAEMDTNIDANYKDKGRKRVREGDSLIYELVAKRYIKPGEEIMWYYGEDYERDYEVGKE